MALVVLFGRISSFATPKHSYSTEEKNSGRQNTFLEGPSSFEKGNITGQSSYDELFLKRQWRT
jgi:hypothetical protein